MEFIKPISKKELIAAQSVLGNDEGSFVMRFKDNPKAKPIKAKIGRASCRERV
jgi:hypothetical protein